MDDSLNGQPLGVVFGPLIVEKTSDPVNWEVSFRSVPEGLWIYLFRWER